MSTEENDKSQEVEDIKEIIIGDYKPKRKFLNFVSAVNGAKIRYIRDIAFVKGEKLSGMLEGAIFKITICDEGTIKFEEQGRPAAISTVMFVLKYAVVLLVVAAESVFAGKHILLYYTSLQLLYLLVLYFSVDFFSSN